MTPDEVVTNIDRLNGQTVTVAGYLSECAGYECVLYTDQKQANLAKAWTDRLQAAAHAKKQFSEKPDSSWYLNSLGIGTGGEIRPGDKSRGTTDCYFEFDCKAAKFRHSYVLIKGKVTNRCRFKGEPECLDRSTDLEPISIQAWNRNG